MYIFRYKYASEEIVDTALALAQAYASTGREEAESMFSLLIVNTGMNFVKALET